MANFLTSLWESVFTPGPTPTLLLATNATFAALQAILLALLLATHSAHFIALSFLCAGLWWAVNWFSSELARAQAIEDAAARIRRRRSAQEPGQDTDADTEREKEREQGGGGDGDGDSSDTETETEVEDQDQAPRARPFALRGGPGKPAAVMRSAEQEQPPAQQQQQQQQQRVMVRGGPAKIAGVMRSADEARAAREEDAADLAEASGRGAQESPGLALRRSEGKGASNPDLSSSSMTDSEWEKVSEGER